VYYVSTITNSRQKFNALVYLYPPATQSLEMTLPTTLIMGQKQKVTTRGRQLKKVIPDMPPCAVEAVAGIVCLFADDLTTASQAASHSKAKKTGTTGSGKPLPGHLINWPLSAAVVTQVVRLCLHQKH
jgi:hypothetical protein